jgi:hypothetical protein
MNRNRPTFPVVLGFVLAVALIVVWLPVGAAAAEFQFGPIGVVFAQQAVQVNASHIGDPDQVSPEPSCQADIAFFDATGAGLKRATLTITAGRTASVRLTGPDLAPGPRGKSPVRGHVTWASQGTPSLCRASFEVVDLASGRAILGGTPADRVGPFAIFGAIGVAEGQTFRLNVANLGPPDQTPCEVGLAIFGDTGAVLASELVTLPAGMAATSTSRRGRRAETCCGPWRAGCPSA